MVLSRFEKNNYICIKIEKAMTKYITIDQAQNVYERIRKEYVSPKFMGEPLFTLPTIDIATIFGTRKKMDVEKLTQEIRRIIEGQIS